MRTEVATVGVDEPSAIDMATVPEVVVALLEADIPAPASRLAGPETSMAAGLADAGGTVEPVEDPTSVEDPFSAMAMVDLGA